MYVYVNAQYQCPVDNDQSNSVVETFMVQRGRMPPYLETVRGPGRCMTPGSAKARGKDTPNSDSSEGTSLEIEEGRLDKIAFLY